MKPIRWMSLAVVCLPLWAQDIGRSPAFVVALSENAVQEIEAENNVIDDPVLLDRLIPIVRNIMRASDIRQVFPARILDNEEVNAFALPAGPIYVTIGMINALDSLSSEDSQSMIAGIIGHEIAHVYLRHYVAWARLQQFVKDAARDVPSDVATILDYGYKREQEFEADELGVLYAMRAGYSFEAIVSFYKRVRNLYGEIPPGDEKFKDHPRITERIARLYETRGQIERDFDQFNYGAVALTEGRYPDAVTAFKIFTSTFANSASGWTNLGSAYLFAALAQMPELPVRFMATFYSSPDEELRGTPEELDLAEEAFKRAAELDTVNNVVYYGNAGIIAALAGAYDKAVDLEQKALATGISKHYFYNNLGNVYFLSRKYESAVEAYKQALELDDEWLLPRYNLAMLYEQAGEKDLAVDQWKELLEVSGFRRDAVLNLSRLDPKFKPPAEAVVPETALAGITIGMSEEDLVSSHGQPDQRMTLENLLTIEYANEGLSVFLREHRVSGILGNGDFEGQTGKGVAIGSTTAQVRAAYGLPEDILPQTNEEQWIYRDSGLILNVYDGAVSVIQVVRSP